jgi:hypothetical protein
MSCLDGWGPVAIEHMVANPVFTILRTSHYNALLLFPDGMHGVYLQVEVHEAYRRLGRQRYTRPDPAALPARKTEAQRYTDTPAPPVPADDRVSSSKQDPLNPSLHPPPTPPAVYPLAPRAAWMLEGDHRSDAEADADRRRAMERLLPSSLPPPLPTWRQAQVDTLSAPPLPPPPWPALAWGSNPNIEPSHEPNSYLSHRNGRRTAMIRAIDPDHLLRHEPPPAPGLRIMRPTILSNPMPLPKPDAPAYPKTLPRPPNLNSRKPPCLPSAVAPLLMPFVQYGTPAHLIPSPRARSSLAWTRTLT